MFQKSHRSLLPICLAGWLVISAVGGMYVSSVKKEEEEHLLP